MSKVKWFLLGLGVSTLLSAGAAHADNPIKWGGGASGGAWATSVAAATKLLNEKLKGKYEFQNTPSPSAVSNIRRLSKGELQTAWADFYAIYHAWNGTDIFKDDGKIQNFRAVANVRTHINIYVVLKDSPIKTIADLKGKTVSTVIPGMSANTICVKALDALDMLDKINERNLGFGPSSRALGDRQIDAFCSSGGPTLPPLIRLSHTKELRYLSMTPEQQQKIVKKYPMYTAVTTPGFKRLKGLEEPIRTVAFNNLWLVNERMSDDAVYQMIKTTYDNLPQLSKVVRYWDRLSGNMQFLKQYGMYVHPAAARYWREKGVDLPSEIVKGF